MKKKSGWLLAALCLALCLNGAALAEAQGGVTIDGVPYTVSPTEEPTNFMSEGYEYTLLEDGSAVITGYYGEETAIEIPSELDGHVVSAIGDEAFARHDELTSVYIPGNVVSIGTRAFSRCRELKEITIMDGVASLGNAAFYRCDSLEAVRLPDSVKQVGLNPFADCVHLARILVSDKNPALTVIDGVLFTKDTMRLVSFPKGLLRTDYVVPEGTTEIASAAFYECTFLRSVTMPEGVTAIGDTAFYHCVALGRVNMPESMTSIGQWSFGLCLSLTELTLPEGLTAIGEKAFFASDLLKLTVTRDSYAHSYCESNNLDYVFASV